MIAVMIPSNIIFTLLVIFVAIYPAMNAITDDGNSDNIYRNISSIFIPPFYIITKSNWLF